MLIFCTKIEEIGTKNDDIVLVVFVVIFVVVVVAVIVNRLLYGLELAWLNVAEIRRLNSFQCRCLRVILGIKPAFVSRVSNAKVRQEAGQVQLGMQLLKAQLLRFGIIAGSPESDPIRKLTFIPGGPP